MTIALPAGGWLAFLAILARVAGVVTLAPVFGAPFVPALLRAAIALAIALALWGRVPVAAPSGELLAIAAVVLGETATGLAIGLMSRMAFAAVETMGGLLDVELGFGAAELLNPGSGEGAPALANVLNLFATVLYLVFNAHYVLIAAMADSFRRLPVGVWAAPEAAGPLADAFSGAVLTAVELAVPVLCASFVVTLALAAFSRAVPLMNVFFLGVPVKMVVGLFGLAFLLPVYAGMMHAIFPSAPGALLFGGGGR
ncbi:MAG: flagellar biosynthetic protein FliR [Clostridia bacterium]|nr:flagellar biosynthetic protein FliR [Clostridia bacterium]